MGEILILCMLLVPQTVAAIFAKNMGRNPWFWFFISFVIPIISLIILLFLAKDDHKGRQGYTLAPHVKTNKVEAKENSKSQTE
jgi:hypothetical protein